VGKNPITAVGALAFLTAVKGETSKLTLLDITVRITDNRLVILVK